MRTFHAAALVLLIGSLAGAGCGSESKTGVLPTAPTSVVPPVVVSANALTLSGRVYDTAFRPIGGATIEVLDGREAGKTTIANASGQFGFTGVFEEGTRFRATKEGFLEGTSRLGPSCAPCNPHHWVYFYLGLPIAPANIAGDYTMTIDAPAGCSALPEEARTRTYTATIAAQANQPTAANTNFGVTIGGALLVPGGVWEGFWIFVAGDYLELQMGDLHGQPGLIEALRDDTYYSVDAWGTTTVPSPGTTFTAQFEGEIVHCVMKPGISVLDGDRRHNCSADRSISRVSCPGGRLTLTRR